ATAGGGMNLYSSVGLPMSAAVFDCSFEENRGCAGAGIYTNTGPILVNGCTFRNNNLLLPNPFPCGLGTGGGGIRVTFGRVEISNSSFSSSEHNLLMADLGGAILADQCTFSNVGVAASAIRVDRNSSAVLKGCIVWGDAPIQIAAHSTATVTVTYSDVRRGGAGTPGTGNIEVTPLFKDAANGDLRLR